MISISCFQIIEIAPKELRIKHTKMKTVALCENSENAEKAEEKVLSEDREEIREDETGERLSETGERRTSSPEPVMEERDVGTPDRPGRPSVPTPTKYGTLYGGAPSPGPAPSQAFRPPGFVPPTPPATASTSQSRKVLRLSQTNILSSISEESQQQTTKRTKLCQ